MCATSDKLPNGLNVRALAFEAVAKFTHETCRE